MLVDFDVEGQQGMNFIHCRKRNYEAWTILPRSNGLKLKLAVVWIIEMFLSAVWTLILTAEDPLFSRQWNAALLQICKLSANVHFCLNCSFKH